MSDARDGKKQPGPHSEVTGKIQADLAKQGQHAGMCAHCKQQIDEHGAGHHSACQLGPEFHQPAKTPAA